MKKMFTILPMIPILLMHTSAQAQLSYQLGDAAVGGDVEWSALGRINWKPLTGGPWNNNPGGFFGTGSTVPTMSPYGDILAYTAGGVGDVDGDGYGDYAVTWYEADMDRGDPCGNHPVPWSTNNNTVVNPSGSAPERIGFIRVMSGNPSGGTSGTCTDADEATGVIDTLNVDGSNQTNYIRRIGAPVAYLGDPDVESNFWGNGDNDLWSHEITTLGDIDGDGRDEMMLSANRGQAGMVEIWAYSNRYHNDSNNTEDRWVRLLTITGVNDSSVTEEFGYQSYEGPPPDLTNMSFGRDFNDDGQPDLMIASKFYNDNNTSRNESVGAAWVFMLPKSNVFAEVDRVSPDLCDAESNRDGSTVADDIVDLLPLKLTTNDYSVRITGHQEKQVGHSGTYYPRHFGYDISPAGDIDDDGYLDLTVSAPYHYDDAAYASYVANPSTAPAAHTGRLYFFLSDSSVRTNSLQMNELSPKHYLDAGSFSVAKCGSTFFTYKNKTRKMSSNQISFDSSKADYVMDGSSPASNFGQAPFAGGLIAGVSLNNGASDTDPDLVVMEGVRNRFYVFHDIQSTIATDVTNNGAPISTRLLWDADTTNWMNNPAGVVFDKSMVYEVTSGTDGSEQGVAVKGVRSLPIPASFPTIYDFDGDQVQDQSLYAGITDVRVAGDQNGDGDCEIIVSTQAVWWYQTNGTPIIGAQRQANIVLDIDENQSGQPTVSLIAEYLPESFDFEEIALRTPRYTSQPNSFNAGSSIVRTFGVSVWPLWNSPNTSVTPSNPDGIDDLIFGVRYFPRRVSKYPSNDKTTWLNIPGVGAGNPAYTGKAYDQMTLVPAGKAYLVRTPRQ